RRVRRAALRGLPEDVEVQDELANLLLQLLELLVVERLLVLRSRPQCILRRRRVPATRTQGRGPRLHPPSFMVLDEPSAPEPWHPAPIALGGVAHPPRQHAGRGTLILPPPGTEAAPHQPLLLARRLAPNP